MSQDALFAREALGLRLRLEFGFASLEEVELWADAWLMAVETPSHELVDLALARQSGLHESAKALEGLGGGKDVINPEDIVRAIAGADASDWSGSRLQDFMWKLNEWSFHFIQQSKEGMTGWPVIDAANAFCGPPSLAADLKPDKRRRAAMLDVLKGAQDFAARSDAGSPA